MADRTLTDAMPGIHDEGLPNITDGNEDWGSAGLRMMLAQAVDSDSYVRSDSELTFINHDGTNDQVDVTGGTAYLDLTGETVDVQSSLGGSSPPAYDATLASLPAIPVHVFSTVADLNVQDATLSDVWLAYATDGGVSGISAGDVYLRSDDTGSVTAPPHPSVRIGQVNPDDASADVLLNRFGSPTFNALEAASLNATNQSQVEASLSADKTGVSAGTETNIVDSEVSDKEGIFNSSFEIVPNETAKYKIEAYARLTNGSDGDTVAMYVNDLTNSNNIFDMIDELGTKGRKTFEFSQSFDLVAGDRYSITVVNNDNSYDVSSTDEFTELEVYKRTAQS